MMVKAMDSDGNWALWHEIKRPITYGSCAVEFERAADVSIYFRSKACSRDGAKSRFVEFDTEGSLVRITSELPIYICSNDGKTVERI